MQDIINLIIIIIIIIIILSYLDSFSASQSGGKRRLIPLISCLRRLFPYMQWKP